MGYKGDRYSASSKERRQKRNTIRTPHVVTAAEHVLPRRTWVNQKSIVPKHAEEDIRRLASFPQRSPLSILELDRTGRIIFCNPAATSRLKELDAGDDPRSVLAKGH